MAADRPPEVDLKLKPASTSGNSRAKARLAKPAAALVDAVRICYERELRLRRVTPKAKSATDGALLEAVRAEVEYHRLARAVVPPAADGAEIARVRQLRHRVAVRFRKRVERVTKRHASLKAAAETSLPVPPPEANDQRMQDPRRPLYIRETFYDETVLPPDVARPVHPDADEDEDDEEATELDGPDLDDDFNDDMDDE